MPELPEVETIRRSLEPQLLNCRITDLKICYAKILRKPVAGYFQAAVIGKKILSVERRGKYLLFGLSNDEYMVVHLRMTGKFTFAAIGDPLKSHDHLVFTLDNGRELRYNDVRKFGTFYLLSKSNLNEVNGLFSLGVEPLSAEFTVERLGKLLGQRDRIIKAVLLDQTSIAGLGNIYVDESLWKASIHPSRKTGSLKESEIESLYRSIVYTLRLAIECQGTSVSDYMDAYGQPGMFQERLAVYKRAGLPCLRCSEPIRKIREAGRGTHFCPTCQPLSL